MNALFLLCALSLPGLPQTQFNDYNLLKEFLESKYPGYEVIYVNDSEELMMPGAEWTPLTHDGLRVWTIPAKRAA